MMNTFQFIGFGWRCRRTRIYRIYRMVFLETTRLLLQDINDSGGLKSYGI
jgi:hypothetical protein